jgi:hypothetical protein
MRGEKEKCISSLTFIYYLNERFWLAHHVKKRKRETLKLWRLPQYRSFYSKDGNIVGGLFSITVGNIPKYMGSVE